MYISLDSVEKVVSFVRDIVNYEEEVDLVCGHLEVDAKSIMGIFSLDLRKPIEVKVHSNVKSPKVCELLEKYEIIPQKRIA